MRDQLQQILDENEKVLWEGTPAFAPFFAGSFVFALFGLPFFLAAIAAGVGIGYKMTNSLHAWPIIISTLIIPHFWIGLFCVVGVPLYRILVRKYTYYAITDKRVILQSGLLARNFTMVDYDKITNAQVRVSLADILFGARQTGTITLSTAGIMTQQSYGSLSPFYRLCNVRNPYDVFKFLKQVELDVKTDEAYPNQLRPDTNPGYQTKISTKK